MNQSTDYKSAWYRLDRYKNKQTRWVDKLNKQILELKISIQKEIFW